MVVRMRHTRAHTRNRRSHHALSEPRVSQCPDCKAPHLRHTVCPQCGRYRGRVVIDVTERLRRQEKKMKEKKKERTEEEKVQEKEHEAPLSAEELSKK
jgi:large subunit ribosomal protein L32